jgi:hypothetical protein
MLGGFIVNGIQRMLLHPSGEEDHHEEIFSEYTRSDVWVATHIAEFVLVLIALSGLLVLCHALRREARFLSLLGAGALIATGATWAALQGVDGVTLKQSVDAWSSANGPEEAALFADAETIRWIEWGLQGYFRILLGLAFLLVAAAAAVSRLVPKWLAMLLALAGLLSLAIGISVAYAGLESGFQNGLALVFQLIVLVFAVGLLVAGRRSLPQGVAAVSS